MDWQINCAAVVPCLNEAVAIKDLVVQIQQYVPAVIVVDDGSGDGTGPLAADAGARVVRHDQPRGKGAALQSGWRLARSLGFSWAMTLDGDGQHAPADIPSFLACANTGEARLIVGNRMANPEGMPWVRRRTNRLMSQHLSRMAGQELPDTQCGFRLIDLKAWSALEIETTHFEIESELLLAFAAAGHKIAFVPIQVIYRDEESKIHPLRDTWRWFKWLSARRS